MPRADTPDDLPLALRLLGEDLDEIQAGFAAFEQASAQGERAARWEDLERAVDRYLRLEDEGLFAALKRNGCEHAAAAASHEKVRAALEDVRRHGRSPSLVQALRGALRAHQREQERETWPRAARALAPELPELAVEWNERRNRMDGHYGV